ncbi:16S rRNA (guanine(966)-N(2))-methyltransferase RsmD [Nitrospina watsonii]|uniref:16S rRNA (Guanine(966)-N(2))-methyltransferase RsmD n=1 Tax=Nitrospina watsonii TaxID=1323948 RepID=A0ABM9HEZ9_9BACT|nr:16S rRNA (guanine(966)-N(2))-methyltransferase RsmD [Nitrospina watsonii]CAI2718806.1 16S rRNA (Guanine(966)-N(2))-methyltransferase RsmD [Nitrospina watsonii]
MRVIGGRLRGTRLQPLKGQALRPTLDRVRESLFNIVGAGIEGARVLDLFAGTGAVGIEALSRGASRVAFVEANARVRDLLHGNLEKCRLTFSGTEGSSNWTLLPVTARQALDRLQNQGEVFDWVYVDPPFDADLYTETLTGLAASGLLAERAEVVAEHFHKTALAENYGKLKKLQTRRTGDTCLSFFMLESLE